MAFLQSSSTLLSTNQQYIISPSRPRPRRRFEVMSCETSNRIDRRNMLLGMGGVYTAANLKLAQAAPIPPPDFTKCQESTIKNNQSGATKDVNCCPPPNSVTDFVLPTAPAARIRRPAHKLVQGDPQLAQYQQAIQMMRDLDNSDPGNPLGFTQQAKIHCAYCDAAYPETGAQSGDVTISVHYSWLFFPFHRWYLYFYERILGSLIGDPHFALPYWNWDNPDGMQIPSIFNNASSPLFDLKRNQQNLPPATVDLTMGVSSGRLSDQVQVQKNLAQMYNEMIASPVTTSDFMGQPYRAGDPTPGTACGGTSERGSHISVHKWVGDPSQPFNEDLGNFYSAGYDPLFYSHHANVDRMWTLWECLPTPVPKYITDPDFLNSSFLFYDYDKSLVRVTVADCLDLDRLGYAYEASPIPWLGSRQSRTQGRANLKNLSKGVPTADKLEFPLKLTQTTRVSVPKPSKGKADEVLVLQDVVSDSGSLIKFNVFVNDDDGDAGKINRAEYAGTFAQLAQNHDHSKNKNKIKLSATTGCNLSFSLKELYENINIDDGDTSVVVTLYPIYNGQDVTIGGIKIVQASRK